MSQLGFQKELVEENIQKFRGGGAIFRDNLNIPVEKLQKLHDEAQTPETEKMLETAKRVATVDADAIEELMNAISDTFAKALEQAIQIGVVE